MQYYENVACRFKEFMTKYNKMKRVAIEKERRGSYEAIMGRIKEKSV